jgi:hypothetical protein
MRFLTARRLALAALVPAFLVFSAIPGCSNQSEGERCGDDTAPNNDDCSSGLICVNVNDQAGFNRCCNANPSIVNDSRCLRSSGATGGSGGSSGTGGSGGSTATGAAGTADAVGPGASGAGAGGI